MEAELNLRVRVSVIVTVRNGASFLAQALDSVFAQKYAPYQVILVDGQSEDGSDVIASSYPVEYIFQSTLGLGNARNLGIQHATGELVAFLDHDDIWPADKLKLQLGYMVEHPECRYTTTRFIWFLEPSTRPGNSFPDRMLVAPQSGPTPGTLMAWRQTFVENGFFAQNLMIACDSEWFARARQRCIPTAIIPDVLLHKRLHHTNLSAQTDRYRQEWLLVLRNLAGHNRQTTKLD